MHLIAGARDVITKSRNYRTIYKLKNILITTQQYTDDDNNNIYITTGNI